MTAQQVILIPPTHIVSILPSRHNTAVRWSTSVFYWLLLISHMSLCTGTLTLSPHHDLTVQHLHLSMALLPPQI